LTSLPKQVKRTFLGPLPEFFELHLPTNLTKSLGPVMEDMESNLLKMGNAPSYAMLLNQLPVVERVKIDAEDEILVGSSENCLDVADLKNIKSSILRLIPWRKGPYDFFGQRVDAEWNSALKWDRLSKHIKPLAGRLVLDVGSGNGYFAWRSICAQASAVVCLEPSLLSLAQFRFCKHFVKNAPVEMLPIRVEQFLWAKGVFDTVFSMGVLYHNRNPKEHLKDLRNNLRVGGELILETIIDRAEEPKILVPSGRYASMRNVWSIPSIAMVEKWLLELGFSNPICVNLSTTTPAEQKTSKLMPYNSLIDGLDPRNSKLTIEGYERPTRGVFLATAV